MSPLASIVSAFVNLFPGYKTYISAVLLVVVGVLQLFVPSYPSLATWLTAAQSVVAALGLASLRAAQSTSPSDASAPTDPK